MLRDDLFPFQFIKKSRFTGSYQGMFYRVEKTERVVPAESSESAEEQTEPAEEKKTTVLAAYVFPGPYAYEYTDPEHIISADFPFSEEGYEQAKDWLENQAASRDWLRESLQL